MEDVASYPDDKDDTPVTNGLNVAKQWTLCHALKIFVRNLVTKTV